MWIHHNLMAVWLEKAAAAAAAALPPRSFTADLHFTRREEWETAARRFSPLQASSSFPPERAGLNGLGSYLGLLFTPERL